MIAPSKANLLLSRTQLLMERARVRSMLRECCANAADILGQACKDCAATRCDMLARIAKTWPAAATANYTAGQA